MPCCVGIDFLNRGFGHLGLAFPYISITQQNDNLIQSFGEEGLIAQTLEVKRNMHCTCGKNCLGKALDWRKGPSNMLCQAIAYSFPAKAQGLEALVMHENHFLIHFPFDFVNLGSQ